MPAAAVIPAPIAYAKVAAVKKLVVGLNKILTSVENFSKYVSSCYILYYFEEIKVFQASFCLAYFSME